MIERVMVEELIASIAEGTPAPQAVADEICSLLIEGLADDDEAGRLYLLWAAFSDWFDEFDDVETEAVRTAMQVAALEWMGLDDEAARPAYFERWMALITDGRLLEEP